VSGIDRASRCRFDGGRLAEAFVYDQAPPGETKFVLGGDRYLRAYDRCEQCGHFFARHQMNLSALYESAYVNATYGGPDGMRTRLQTIRALPPGRSDNAGRTARITGFVTRERGLAAGRLLDVGAGIGVFPAAMKDLGWDVEATELDPRTAVHLRETVGVKTYASELAALRDTGIAPFDLIAFNKVLEHVEDPIALLRHAAPLLVAGGHVYVEVPDVAAAQDGPGREEFFIEHLHVFSPASLAMTIERAGFRFVELERLREPSSKFTLFAFATRLP
jgi:2-polyprenyl-3-methyl-5-hydroxy-6-metoxy-1,4-benzoquinol methylase